MPRKASDLLDLTDWEGAFLPHMKEHWRPGEHYSLAALTGAGKTTFMGGLLGIRKYVLAMDVKGGDSVLEALGWERLPEWPGERKMAKMVERNEKDHKPSHYVVGPIVTRVADRPKRLAVIRAALDGAFDMGGWTIYVDELQVATDRRMMDLASQMAELLVSARQPKRITIASSFQAPSWVITEAVRQPVWFAVSQTRDEAVVDRLAEVMGKDKHELMGAMRGLDPHCFLVVNRNPYDPILVTKPAFIA